MNRSSAAQISSDLSRKNKRRLNDNIRAKRIKDLDQKIIDAMARQIVVRRKYQAYAPQKNKSGV